MMDSKIYVLKMDYADPAQTQGGPTRVRLIGPFTTNDAAVHWAGYREAPDINPNNPADNPCWQIVLLDNPTVHLEAP